MFYFRNLYFVHVVVVTAKGHSIFVSNLPFNATVEQLDEAFKKFGPIKRDGIQVRSNKVWFAYYFLCFSRAMQLLI